MKLKEIIKRILFYISVPKCVLCKERLDYDERGLCRTCMKEYIAHKERNCPRCSNVLSKCFCSYETLADRGINNLVKLFRYSKSEQSMPSNYLIYSLKQDNREDVLSFLADELADAIRYNVDPTKPDLVITNVPRRAKAIIDFGYDHARDLAKEVGKRLNVEYVDILRSKSRKSQKSVFGEERSSNAKFVLRRNLKLSLKGKTVILLDDIVTTGSSMSNSASVIKTLRPKRIIGACLGTAYKEKRIDYEYSAFK